MSDARHIPKINPALRQPTETGHEIDRVAGGNEAIKEWAAAGLAEPDLDVMRAYRLGRIRDELKKRDFSAAILTDPLNIRYATDSMNMQIWTMHNAVRYAFIATEGPVILFDFHDCGHLTAHLPLITESRGAKSWFYFESGSREMEHAQGWAEELADLVHAHSGGNPRIAIDKCEPPGVAMLERLGVQCTLSMEFAEEARRIKHAEEVKAIRRAVNTTEIGMREMWRALTPGMTENQLWSILHQTNIARGGEWIETRLLASGPRTNPWFHECSDRVIEAGDIVSFDTDLVGPYGYCADISRAWVAGARPTNEQQDLINIAQEQIAFNMDVFRVGMSFKELSDKSYQLPDDFIAGRYSCVLHGVGLCDEYPSLKYREDWDDYGYDGVFEPGMVVCFESYIGRDGGREGVKLERQALVTETGLELIDTFSDALVPEV